MYGSPSYSGIKFILKVWVVLFIVGADGLDEQPERNKNRIIEHKNLIEKESSLKKLVLKLIIWKRFLYLNILIWYIIIILVY